MTENERRIKKRVQLIVGASMSVFFALVITLVVQLAVLGNQNSMRRNLERTQTALTQQIAHEEQNLRYYTSEAFIQEWLLRELGYGREGAQLFR